MKKYSLRSARCGRVRTSPAQTPVFPVMPPGRAACESSRGGFNLTPTPTQCDGIASVSSAGPASSAALRFAGQFPEKHCEIRDFSILRRARVSAASRDGRYVDLARTDSTLPWSLKELLAGGPEIMRRAAAAHSKGATIDPGTVRVLAPIPEPQKVICVGLNYADHARESGLEPPPEPVIFNKFPTAVAAHGDAIPLPGESHEVDYEAELVVVVNRRVRALRSKTRTNTSAAIASATMCRPATGRAASPASNGCSAKRLTASPLSAPNWSLRTKWVIRADLRIQCRVNGQTLQDSNTDQLIFSVPRLIAYISQVCTLMPGDVIFTGTPPGVGFVQAADLP